MPPNAYLLLEFYPKTPKMGATEKKKRNSDLELVTKKILKT